MSEFEEPTKCSVCKKVVLYGSRHHACGSYAMGMEKQIEQQAKEIEALRGYLLEEYKVGGLFSFAQKYGLIDKEGNPTKLLTGDKE